MDRQQYLDITERTGWTLFELLSGSGVVDFWNNVMPAHHADPVVWAPVIGAVIAAIKSSVAAVLANNGVKSVAVIPSQTVTGNAGTRAATVEPPVAVVTPDPSTTLTNY